MIGIIDYGAGNLYSVCHAFESVGADIELCSDTGRLDSYERLVLPGVGSFSWCYKNLHEGGWIPLLNTLVLKKKTPILGICVGMQLMATVGHEGGKNPGLGWFKGEILRLPSTPGLKIPHIGWNSVDQQKKHPLFNGIPNSSDFYFANSYSLQSFDPAEVVGTCEHGARFPVALEKENIFGVQFHPEKSQSAGLTLVENFSRWAP